MEDTAKGKIPFKDSSAAPSQRKLAARYGISKSGVQTMVKRAAEVDLTEFPREALDAGTGWPKWKYLRSTGQWDSSDAELRKLKS